MRDTRNELIALVVIAGIFIVAAVLLFRYGWPWASFWLSILSVPPAGEIFIRCRELLKERRMEGRVIFDKRKNKFVLDRRTK